MECLRYLPYLSKSGWVVTNAVPFVNIPNYPEPSLIINEINKLSKHVLLNADELAEKAGTSRALNMVILGAASPFIDIPKEYFKAGIVDLFIKKGEQVVQVNLNAFNLGREISIEKMSKTN